MITDNVFALYDTLDICRNGYYTKEENKIKLKLSEDEQRISKVLLPDEVQYICENPTIKEKHIIGRIGHFCVNEDSFSVARRIKQSHSEEKVLVLNFANPVHPGGGVRNGSNAQEENLCRKSSLLVSLEDKLAERYYKYNSSLDTYMGSDAILISPNVEIIKDENGNLLDETFVVSVMTCAAPRITRGLEGMSNTEYENLLYKRITGMLKVAANYGYEYLVLGAWGCGAFGNDPEVVAEIFYKVLCELIYNNMSHESLFKQIHFAVLDKSIDKYNYLAFEKRFTARNFYKVDYEAIAKKIEKKRKEKEKNLDKIKGSLFGGAMGDALGYPVEFLNEEAIFAKYGKNGITEYELTDNGKAQISDDTQMTLFTANGMLVGETRHMMRGVGGAPHHYIWNAYRDWLHTQEEEFDKKKEKVFSWLNDVPELYSRRAPGNTCISAISRGVAGTVQEPINNSKGCGGIMRVAPLPLHYETANIETLDEESANVAALTHGHSLGYMPAAVLTHILYLLVYGREKMPLKATVQEARDVVARIYTGDKHIEELISIINQAIALSENDDEDLDNIHRLGAGWVAEETLAIAIYCSLKYQNDFSEGIITAVNHSGDSDSTGAVTGNILGALLGFEAIDDKWKKNLELYDVIDEMALDVCHGCMMNEYGHYIDPKWVGKYVDMRWGKRSLM